MRAVTVVAPTEHLKTQWADAAGRVGIQLNPSFSNSSGVQSQRVRRRRAHLRPGRDQPGLHRRRTEAVPTLVILDEVHHGGDARSWGEGIREAFTPAARRLSLTGTPFRSDTNPIPFVRYEMDEDGILRSASDYTYGYAAALRDGVVRPVLFLAYGGAMRWRTKAGDEVAARLGRAADQGPDGARLAHRAGPQGRVDPVGARGRRQAALRGAPARARRRRAGHRLEPDRGPRVRRASSRAITGEETTVVLSDDAGASARIERFSDAETRWMVAVRMVSEGVDVPRLAVGVYATSTSTPLFFAQAVGRFVRARRRGETASVFLPVGAGASSSSPRRWRRSATTPSTAPAATRTRPRCGPRRRG